MRTRNLSVLPPPLPSGISNERGDEGILVPRYSVLSSVYLLSLTFFDSVTNTAVSFPSIDYHLLSINICP